MTIGQVTISAADWLASRVSDRMALVVAGQKSDLAQQTGSKAVQPAEENAGTQIERRARERSILAAQESYKRVAQRIKSRLANPLPPADDAKGRSNTAFERATVEKAGNGARTGAAPGVTEAKPDSAVTSSGQARPDAVLGLVEPDSKKAEDRQAASVDEKEKDVIRVAIENLSEQQAAHDLTGFTPTFEKGLWDDLFVAEHLSREA